MSERWKFQLLSGMKFGVFMTLFMTGFTCLTEGSFAPFFRFSFLYMLAVLVAAGVFVKGYYDWRELQRRRNKLSK